MEPAGESGQRSLGRGDIALEPGERTVLSNVFTSPGRYEITVEMDERSVSVPYPYPETDRGLREYVLYTVTETGRLEVARVTLD